MATVNVNRNVDDVFYRYKMPRLVAKVEGKGNGIKTVIANMPEIAKALSRPPTYATKYFGCELGAQTQFDMKNERYIVNGEHDAQKLQELLDGFIRKFVLCPSCDNPETNLVVKPLGGKQHLITQSCLACGFSRPMDQKHKLTTFIVKNPPPVDKQAEAAAKRAANKASGKEDRGSGTPSDEEEIGLGDTNIENEVGSGSGETEDDEELLDSSGAGMREQLSGAMAALVLNPDLDLPVEERLDIFYKYLQSVRSKASSLEAMDGKALVREADRLDVKDKSALLLCRVVFDIDILSQIKPARQLLLRFTNQNQKAQKYLLGGVEQLIMSHREELLSKVPKILDALYDADIVDEEVILDWGKKPSKRYVSREQSKEILAKAEPFLTWLKTADEESEEEEDDVQVNFEVEKKPMTKAPAASVQNGHPEIGEGANEDDFDIDDI